MPNETRELVRFGVETDFEDLPNEVRHEAKRVFLDSVGSLGVSAIWRYCRLIK